MTEYALLIEGLDGHQQAIQGYFSSKQEALNYLRQLEGQYRDYVVVTRSRYESYLGIRRAPKQLYIIPKPPRDRKFTPPLAMSKYHKKMYKSD